MSTRKRKSKEQKRNEILYIIFFILLFLGFFMAILACPLCIYNIINEICMGIFLLGGGLLFNLSKLMLDYIYRQEMWRERMEEDKTSVKTKQ